METFSQLSDADKLILSGKIAEVKAAKEQKEKAEAYEKEKKEELLQIFKSLGLTSYSAHDTFVRYFESASYLKLNSAKLKKEIPEIFTAYSAPAERKEYLTVRIKDNENSDAKFIEKYYTEE
ncbi:hypothetical protein MmiHf6_13170 [Methanimicrococcus hongohii]|uniref:Uncharacterized protein n=1 Tax=Methanimicrococcus hongohii TaxID=3028295 RepID=A0AA96ZUP4_9EURY|nr:hypothetical protein [Methanimicrococcus sp. Hf6]WNY23992.1 hypothetical protein MmiHf6_13170 [Methanimicrococcus sp. Hf6]